MRAYRRDRWVWQPQPVKGWSEQGTVHGTQASTLQDSGVTLRVMYGPLVSDL